MRRLARVNTSAQKRSMTFTEGSKTCFWGKPSISFKAGTISLSVCQARSSEPRTAGRITHVAKLHGESKAVPSPASPTDVRQISFAQRVASYQFFPACIGPTRQSTELPSCCALRQPVSFNVGLLGRCLAENATPPLKHLADFTFRLLRCPLHLRTQHVAYLRSGLVRVARVGMGDDVVHAICHST